MSETGLHTGLNRAERLVRQRVAAMGHAPVWKLLPRFSGPAILSMVAAAGYTVVDAIFIGRLGPAALGALPIVFSPILLVMALSMGTGVGAASFISRSLGAGDHESANRCAAAAITLAILIGVLVGIICLSNLEVILCFFGARGKAVPPAKAYLSILATFACLHSAMIVIGNLIRAEGSPVMASAAVIVATLTNFILDPILIFLHHFLAGRSTYNFGWRNFIPYKPIIFEIYHLKI